MQLWLNDQDTSGIRFHAHIRGLDIRHDKDYVKNRILYNCGKPDEENAINIIKQDIYKKQMENEKNAENIILLGRERVQRILKTILQSVYYEESIKKTFCLHNYEQNLLKKLRACSYNMLQNIALYYGLVWPIYNCDLKNKKHVIYSDKRLYLVYNKRHQWDIKKNRLKKYFLVRRIVDCELFSKKYAIDRNRMNVIKNQEYKFKYIKDDQKCIEERREELQKNISTAELRKRIDMIKQDDDKRSETKRKRRRSLISIILKQENERYIDRREKQQQSMHVNHHTI